MLQEGDEKTGEGAEVQRDKDEMLAYIAQKIKEHGDNDTVAMMELQKEYPYVDESVDGQHEVFHTDEEPENSESQKEDMKIYLSKLNKKIDILVESLKDAEGVIKSQTDRKNISDLIKLDAEGQKIERQSISAYFNNQIQTKTQEQEQKE